MPAEVTNDGIIDLDAPEAEAKVEDNEDKAEGEAEAKTEGEEDRGDGDKPKKPSGAQRAKIREQRLLDETHPRDRELEDKRAAHNQPCVRLIVSIEGNDRLVSIALGERHQVAIRSLATGALVPVAAKEVGVTEGLNGVLKTLVGKTWEAYKMDATSVYRKAAVNSAIPPRLGD